MVAPLNVPRRSLWPREHGAYAQLAAPLASALAVGEPPLAAILLALGACFAFLANEPLLVVLGHRGARHQQAHGRRAARRLSLTASLAVGAGAAGLWLASRDTLIAAGLAGAAASILIALAWRRREHSLAGELVAALALPGAAAPVAVASGVALRAEAVVWGAWAIGYACSVVAVHRVIARHRHPRSRIDALLTLAFGAVAAGSVALATWAPAAVVATPLLVVALALVLHPPPATRLRAVGVTLVIASAASATAAILTG